MPNWKLTDQFATTYPGLGKSILSQLVFSQHSLNGEDFTGTIDIAATGKALGSIGALLGVESIAVEGRVEASANLNITLTSTDASSKMVTALKKNIPLIGDLFTSATLDLGTSVDNQPDSKPADVFDFLAGVSIGNQTANLKTEIPIGSGFIVVEANPNFEVGLEDLDKLLLGKSSWPPNFPSEFKKLKLKLLNVSLNLYLDPDPLDVVLVSITGAVGIAGEPIIPEKLYLNPLGVWMTVTNPIKNPTMSYGLSGTLALTNFEKPTDFDDADFDFDFLMSLRNFAINGKLEEAEEGSNKHAVNNLLKDILGSSVDIGIPDKLTVDQFEFDATTDQGKVDDFSMKVAMSGGFGLFENLDLEEFSLELQRSQ